MPKGLFLTMGLNSVDPAAYEGWDGILNACENDATDIAAIASKAGFTGRTLLTKAADSVTFLGEMHKAAKSLSPGDMLVLAYSGHGGQVGDANSDEDDGLDETWCLYDRMLIDDELYAMWSQFKPGVRILVLSDSCHSGTVVKMNEYKTLFMAVKMPGIEGKARVKAIPFDKAWSVYQNNKALYDTLQYVAGASEKAAIGASVVLISGCQDNQLSLDGEKNGMFTGMLKKVWSDGAYQHDYRTFRDDITKSMPPTQTPNYFVVGAPNPAFAAQKPFTL